MDKESDYKQETIQVMLFKIGEPMHLHTFKPSLEAMQELVGGHIESVGIDRNLILICNEEGKFNGSKPNRLIRELNDVIYGDFFITTGNGQGEFKSLDGRQINRIVELSAHWAHTVGVVDEVSKRD